MREMSGVSASGLRAVLVSSSDPRSTSGFSGTLHSMYCALSPRFAELRPVHTGFLLKLASKLAGAHKRLTGRSGNYYFHPLFTWLAGRQVSAALRGMQADVVICAAASSVIARVKTDLPVIYCTDATFAALTRLYPNWQALPDWNLRAGNNVEQLSLDQAAAIVMSSEWARQSAAQDYEVDPARITVLPYGPNLRADLLPASEPAIASNPAEELQILYTGFDWRRKGGEFAVDVVRRLNDLGHKARLHIVGRSPDEVKALPFVTDHGLINKDVDGSAERMAAIYRASHVFLLPTIADATPVVFSEAAAFALPSITFDVGGVASAVKHGESGLVFPAETGADQVARRIGEMVANGEELQALRRSSFAWSKKVANWDAWADGVQQLALKACSEEGVTDAMRSAGVGAKEAPKVSAAFALCAAEQAGRG